MEFTLEDLTANLTTMFEKTSDNFDNAWKSEKTFEEVLVIEKEINKLHKSIDDSVYKFLALQAPHAKDLRAAITTMKTNSELERIADQSVTIARYFRSLSGDNFSLTSLYKSVLTNYTNVMTAYAEENVSEAVEIIRFDEEINSSYRLILNEAVKGAKSGKIELEEAIIILRLAKNLERIGDHVTNIAENIIFLESGDDIRHNPSK